jgi:hypothetical protein
MATYGITTYDTRAAEILLRDEDNWIGFFPAADDKYTRVDSEGECVSVTHNLTWLDCLVQALGAYTSQPIEDIKPEIDHLLSELDAALPYGLANYMHRLYLEEGLGLGSVAKRLNDEGIRTRCGNIWYADGIKKAMFHEALLGKIAYGKTRIVKVPSGDGLEMVKKRIRGNLIVRNAHDPVISDERFQNLLDELKRRREMSRGASVLSPKVYVLSGILVCDYCGGPLYAKGTRMSRNGDTLYYYQCYNHQKAGTCRSNFSSRKLEAQAESLLREMVRAVDPSTFVDHYLDQRNPGDTPEDVEARLRGLLEKQKRLQDGYWAAPFH